MNNLERTLGLKDLTLLVMGAVIGSGIYLVPGGVLQQTGGTIALALLVWFSAGVLSLLGGLTYGELSAANPEAGGIYVYIRDAFGSLPAFLYGWTLFFVISAGAIATLAVAFSTYLNELVPADGLNGKIVSLIMIGVITWLNVRGTRQSADVQNVTTAIKAAGILVMSLLFVVLGNGFEGTGERVWPSGVSLPLFSSVLTAMIGVLWAYEGWQYATFSAGETIRPQHTFPRGMIYGTAALILLYCLANIGYIAVLGPDGVAGSNTVAADAAGKLFGPAAARLIAVIILISIFSAANSILLTSPRVYFAMARDGIFFRRLAEVHPRFGTPAFAVAAQAIVAAILAATGTFEQLLTYVVFTGWIFYALGAASIFVFRRKYPEMERPFRVPGYPFTPLLFVIAAAAIVINAVISQPGRVIVGLGIVLLGAPAYYIWQVSAKPALE